MIRNYNWTFGNFKLRVWLLHLKKVLPACKGPVVKPTVYRECSRVEHGVEKWV